VSQGRETGLPESPFGHLVFGVFLLLLPLLAPASGQSESDTPGLAGEAAAPPPLAPDLRNLWDGSWWAEVRATGGTSHEESGLTLLAEALKRHRAEFEALGAGRRETVLQAIRAALPDEVALPSGEDGVARAARRLAGRIHPLYERLHRNRMDEHFEAARSLDAFGPGALGESALTGDLLADAVAYAVDREGLAGDDAAVRARAIIEAKTAHFVAWIRQRRKPEQETCRLIWTDWAETEGTFYPEPEPSDESLRPVLEALREWYYTAHLPDMTERIEDALEAESAYDAGEFPEETVGVLKLMLDRSRYEAAFVAWKKEQAKTLAALGVEPSPDRDLAAQLEVDPLSGRSIHREEDQRTRFLRRAVYGKFLTALAEVERSRNEQAKARVEAMDEARRIRAREALRRFERPAP
jgi:hypothetical protein